MRYQSSSCWMAVNDIPTDEECDVLRQEVKRLLTHVLGDMSKYLLLFRRCRYSLFAELYYIDKRWELDGGMIANVEVSYFTKENEMAETVFRDLLKHITSQ